MSGSTSRERRIRYRTLSRIDMLDNKTGRDLKEIEIFQISREDRIFGEEMRDIKTMQRADGKSGKVIERLEKEVSGSAVSYTHLQEALRSRIMGTGSFGGHPIL